MMKDTGPIKKIAHIVRKARGDRSRAEIVESIGWSNSALRAVEDAQSEMSLFRAHHLLRHLNITLTIGAKNGKRVRM